MRTLPRLAVVCITVVTLTGLSGCALAVGAAVGGTAVYILKDHGYRVQSPVTR
jgi:TRAP-type C4-dicarboxylate transport system permease large subunit